MITQKIFDETVDWFIKLYDISLKSKIKPPTIEEIKNDLENGIDVGNPWLWMQEYNTFNKEIILYFDSIDIEWSKQYHYDRNNFPNEPTFFPNIHNDFKNYVENLMEEKYIECGKLKEKIFTSY